MKYLSHMSANVASLTKSAVLFLTLAMGATGCTSDATADADASEVNQAGATIVFSSFSERVTGGKLTVGSTVKIDYDESRLTKCRGELGGRPSWAINGFYSIGDSKPKSFWVAGHSVTGQKDKPTIKLDQAGDLAIWFENTNSQGCDAFDSDSGNNFHFDVEGAKATATVTFSRTGEPRVTGTLTTPGTLAVKYDAARLDTCRGTQGGIDQWTITGFASLNGAKATQFTVAGLGASTTTTPTIDLSEDGELEIWFENVGKTGCNDYDSKNGENYRFNVR